MGREEDSGWGTHVNLWQIHFDIWQNQYNIVKLKNKIKLKKKECSVRNAKVLGFHVRLCEWTVSEICRCVVLSAAPAPSASKAVPMKF